MATVNENNERLYDVAYKIAEDLGRNAEVVVNEDGRIDIIGLSPATLGLAFGDWVHIRPDHFDVDWLGRFMFDETAD